MSRSVPTPHPVFTRCVRTRGGLQSSYVFVDDVAVRQWREQALLTLEQQYGPLTLEVSDLPGFKVGDTCCVLGEGLDTFVIEALIQYSPHRYGFALDSGWCEEVAKCFSP